MTMRSILSFLFLLSSIYLLAQPMNKPSYETMIQVAQEAMDSFDYYHAQEWYDKAYEERRDRELLPVLADISYQLRNYSRAERQYSSILRRDEDEGRYYHLYYPLGRVAKMNGNYEEAEEYLIEFIAMGENDSLIQLARKELEGARMALNLPDRSRGVEVENIGRDINSRNSEYSPVLGRTGDRLYFTTFDQNEVVQVSKEGLPDVFAQIMVSQKGERDWEDPTPLGEEVNRPETHTINVALSPSGNQMFLVRGEFMSSKLIRANMYYSTGGDGNWKGAREVQGINGDYIVKNPTVGELFGREVLIFSSDMPGGKGGFDLYYATREGEGVYSRPVNLGETINTLGDEETPFYFDGTLYFSSTGHPGIGGFDIFFSAWDGSNWTEPENMGKGFNSPQNDLYFSIDREGYNGLLVSNRPGQGARSLENRTCCYDIYNFTIPEVYANLVVGLFDEAAREPLLGGSVFLYPYTGNTQEDPTIQTSEKGNRFDYSLDLETYYKVVASAPGYFPDSLTLNTMEVKESTEFVERFYLKKRPVLPPEPEFDTIALEEAIVLENILYDFDEDRIRDEAEPDLEVIYNLMTEYPDMKIELSSHTDYRGDNDYNEDLSQRRAESARRWLVRKGISRDRIDAKGYGETQPFTVKQRQANLNPFLQVGDVLTPEFIDDLPTEAEREAAHFINRRTEFKIIEGPTSIIIRRTELRKKNALPVLPPQSSSSLPDSLISPMSSLYGQKNLKNVPIMVFDERIIDFGRIKRGEKREHTYTFVNKGDADLVISLVSACECTETDYSTQAVAPGESGEIHIVFDSTEKEESEEVFIDIFLENEDPRTQAPILERLKYKFELTE